MSSHLLWIERRVASTPAHLALRTPSGAAWMFESDHDVEMEESLYMTHPDQPERSRQLVISLRGVKASGARITWKLTKQAEGRS